MRLVVLLLASCRDALYMDPNYSIHFRSLPPRMSRHVTQVLMIHNETCNIWTHLVGLAIFVAITTSMVFGWGGARKLQTRGSLEQTRRDKRWWRGRCSFEQR